MEEKCFLCPRKCGVERSEKVGFCGVHDTFKIARAGLHFWEEPCISGKSGSGTIFFSGCNLRCVYCRNFEISHGCFGKEISEKRLLEIFDELILRGANNINLVNPTHYAKRIASVLSKHKPSVPVVYNSSGFESVETLKMLDGLVDIYLPDLKYISNDRSKKYSSAEFYFENASKAIEEMKRRQPDDVFEGELLKKGVIIRHLILPKNTNQSIKILEYIAEKFGNETLLSLMARYTPCGKIDDFPELQRKITQREYEKVVFELERLGFKNAFVRELSSATTDFIPKFDLSGV